MLPSPDPEAFGRMSERIARFIGTGRFLVIQTVVIIVWMLWNVSVPKSLRFDAYPFLFLTLGLSLQAAYAAPLILLAQNRQDDRDRANLAQDRDQNAILTADAEYITREVASLRVALGEVVTRDFLRAELRTLLDEFPGLVADSARDDRPKKRKRDTDGSGEKRKRAADPVSPTELASPSDS
jgi:uncharacterized membrane protein